MKPNAPVKLAAVASSVLLLAAFVSYRAGAFSRLMESTAPPAKSMMPSSKLQTLVVAPSSGTPDAKPPATSQEPPLKSTERARTLIGGSKSFIMVPRQLFVPDAQPPSASDPFNPFLFDLLDRNGDGRLTREELEGTVFAKHFDEIDSNKDGAIDNEELEAYLKKQPTDNKD
jgi:EF hand